MPAEADSGGFDTVAANQSMSSLHVRAYLDAADRALDAALRTGPAPGARRHVIDYTKSRYLWGIEHARALGLGIVKRVPDAYVMFFDFGSTYTFHSASEGFAVTEPGRYRVTVEAYPYQADTPVTLTVYQGKMAGVAASLDELIGTFDLEAPRAVEMRPYLRPGDLIGLSVADLDVPPEAAGYGPSDPSQGYGGMKDYPGEGIAVRSMTIEGPLPEGDDWPPASMRQLLPGDRLRRRGRDRADEGTLRARRRRRRGLRAPRVPPPARRRGAPRPTPASPSRCWPMAGRSSKPSACRSARS